MERHKHAQSMQNFTAWSKALIDLDAAMKRAGHDFLTFAQDAVERKLKGQSIGMPDLSLYDFAQGKMETVPQVVEVDSEQFM